MPPRPAALSALLLLLCGAATAMNVGDAAPNFSRPDLAERPLQLADYHGKVVLLNFWASWCAPCLEEMPRFSRWQRQYGARGLQVIGVSMDDDAAAVRQHLAGHPVAYPAIIGDAKLGATFGGVMGLPLTYLIDRQGRIAARYQGESNLAAMEAQIKALLER